MNIYKQRLLNVARALRESPNRTGIPPSILAIFKEKALVAFSLIVTVFGVIHK